MSLALEHKRRVLASGGVVQPVNVAYSPDTALASPANAQKHLALMTAALSEDLARLSDINSMEAKQELKRDELLPKYLDYVQRYRDSGMNYANPVLMQVLVWLFDTAQLEQGMELAAFALEQGQTMPERFKRDIPTFVADAVIDWAESEHQAKRSPEPYLSDLLPQVDGPWKLYERIPARYHKLAGVLAMEQEQWAKAIEHFQRAETLYPEIGVKTRRESAEKALRKQQAANGTE